MNNIISYVEAFRAVSYREKPLDAVDGLVLACFSYTNLEGLVPNLDSGKIDVSIQNLDFYGDYQKMFEDTYISENSYFLFREMLQSRRFGDIRLNYFVNRHDEQRETQFSAVTLFIGGSTWIIYRGTDDTSIAWKENFNMSYMPVVPAQSSALAYLTEVSELTRGNIYLCGHSKGGNLAVYAASYCNRQIQQRISSVFTYDSPGFKENIYDQKGYRFISNRIQRYIPDSSIIGLLLKQPQNYFVVKSSSIGILQHDAFTWIVKEGEFVYMDELNRDVVYLDYLLNEWMDHIDEKDRQLMVDGIYRIMSKNHLTGFMELKEKWEDITSQILKDSTIVADVAVKTTVLTIRDLFRKINL